MSKITQKQREAAADGLGIPRDEAELLANVMVGKVGANRHLPSMLLGRKDNRVVLTLSPNAFRLLLAPTYVQVLIGTSTLAVRAAEPGMPQARFVRRVTYDIGVPEIGNLLALEEMEWFRLLCELVSGHLVAELPGHLVERMHRTREDVPDTLAVEDA